MSIQSKKIKKSLAFEPVTLANLTNPQVGEIALDDSDNQLKQYNGTGWEVVGAGAGSGGINYIENSDAEIDVSGYAAYADAAQATPVDGTGGSPAVTITRNTTSPLRGDADFLITKGIPSSQGEGVSYDFTIDSADQAKVLRISFDYKASSGFSYNNGDITVYIYDVTNAALIYPTVTSLDGSGKFISEFQTAPDSTSYRLIFHVASDGEVAWTFNFDNVQVGPREIAKGPIVTDWETYTGAIKATTTNPTIASYDTNICKWRRVGANMQVEINIATNAIGSSGSGTYVFTMPSGFTPVVSGSLQTSATRTDRVQVVGTASVSGNAATAGWTTNAFAQGSAFLGRAADLSYGVVLEINNGSNGIVGSGYYAVSTSAFTSYSVKFEVPIVGWSSNAVQSTDFGNRVIAAKIYKSAAQSIPNSTDTTITFDTFLETTGGISLNTSTGVVTIEESGWYFLHATGQVNPLPDQDVIVTKIKLNGLDIAYANGYSSVSGAPSAAPSTVKKLVKGDQLSVVIFQNSGVSLNTINAHDRTSFSIHKIQSPQTLLGSEVVALFARRSTSQVFTTATETDVIYQDVINDTHNAYNTSTGIFTAPIAGTYHISGSIGWVSGSGFDCYVSVNTEGSNRSLNRVLTSASATVPTILANPVTIFVPKGGQIKLRAWQNSGSNKSTEPSGAYNTISIHKIN